MIVPVPPVAIKVMNPFCPAQLGLVPVAVRLIAVGTVITTDFETVHPFESVASIVYVPVAVVVYGDVATTLFTLKVIAPVPPVALKLMLPFWPAQFGLVPVAVTTINVGIVTVTCFDIEHPLASVTVTV